MLIVTIVSVYDKILPLQGRLVDSIFIA